MQSWSSERVPNFTDAGVAIALTLLVLPVAEHAAQDPAWYRDSEVWFPFVLSFVVIAGYWRIHHRLFDLVERVDGTLMTLNMFWLFGIVVMPVTTAALEAGDPRVPDVLYACNLMFLSLAGLAMGLWIDARPRLRRPGAAELSRQSVRRGIAVNIVVALAVGLTVLFDAFGLLALLALPFAQRLAVHRTVAH